MPSQVLSTVENSFTKGLITEFTGMNFPENAATDASNVEFSIIGNVARREGINYETNYALTNINRTNLAISTYKWNNVGGDGLTQIIVEQVGTTLRFFRSSSATTTSPLSTQLLGSTVDVSAFVASGGTFDGTLECQYTDGNGYLFVFHPSCDPIYCTYSSGTITGNLITVQVRDFAGVIDNLPVNSRPTLLSNDHLYNLSNQGWTQGAAYVANSTLSTSWSTVIGSKTFTVESGISGVTLGDNVNITLKGTLVASGNVTAYSGSSMTVSITSVLSSSGVVVSGQTVVISPTNHGYITTWSAALGNYPSNADQWWSFKNTSNVFDPATTISNVTLNIGSAPKGHYVFDAFNQRRSIISSISTITDVTTTVRPRTGCWYQGRVWYTGVDAQQPAVGDAQYTTWTENIYFSQIATGVQDFGHCYQTNDPTSETLFDLLPTDGGVITIQGSGSIYKLFPLQNALLVFAANGVWYVTGSQGIGFSANDYTIVKLSAVRSISSTSFVDVNGLPMFWNEEGIYTVEGAKQGTGLLNSPLHVNPLEVQPITVGTILTFYNAIPLSCKKYARGAYNPIDYAVQWVYRNVEETTVSSRYQFDTILNYNNYNKAFFPYSIIQLPNKPHIHGIDYVAGPGGSTSPDPVFKYLTAAANLVSGNHDFTFSEENDDSYTDFVSFDGTGFDFDSTFTTGFRLHGQGQRRFQIPYIYVFSHSSTPTSYKIQGLWDYAVSGTSGRWGTNQLVNNAQTINNYSPNFSVIYRRHRIRGQGLVLQIRVSSVAGMPFDIIGWSSFETQNTGV